MQKATPEIREANPPSDRLPRSVEDVRQNFITSVQAIAVVTALFAGIQTQLLSGIPTDPPENTSRSLITTLTLVSYGGLSINVGAALSAMIFLDIAGEAPEAFRRLQQKKQSTMTGASSQLRSSASTDPERFARGLKVLVLHGSPRTLQLAWYHCISSTILGTFSILLQISFLAWINIPQRGVFAVTVLALFWASLPLPGFLIYRFLSGLVAGVKEGLES
ncbi:hypothetical protein C8J57DRAFT_1066650 [Mycena rebaudengoi]|nr:hypothetical protein C8J57DRAFT_1066650 [Mycena rebaudengoi]